MFEMTFDWIVGMLMEGLRSRGSDMPEDEVRKHLSTWLKNGGDQFDPGNLIPTDPGHPGYVRENSGTILFEAGPEHECDLPLAPAHRPGTVFRCDCRQYWVCEGLPNHGAFWTRISVKRARRIINHGGTK